MMRYVKNIWIYHFVVTIPLVWLSLFTTKYDNPTGLVIFSVLFYAFVFRPVIDYYRLLYMNEIKKEDFYKMWKWFGFYRFKYYSKLMFGR